MWVFRSYTHKITSDYFKSDCANRQKMAVSVLKIYGIDMRANGRPDLFRAAADFSRAVRDNGNGSSSVHTDSPFFGRSSDRDSAIFRSSFQRSERPACTDRLRDRPCDRWVHRLGDTHRSLKQVAKC